MLKIAVCDDEPVFVEQISGRIKKYMPDVAIQGFFPVKNYYRRERCLASIFWIFKWKK